MVIDGGECSPLFVVFGTGRLADGVATCSAWQSDLACEIDKDGFVVEVVVDLQQTVPLR